MRREAPQSWRPYYRDEHDEISMETENGWDDEENAAFGTEEPDGDIYGGLDANLVSSLLRWVANVKRRLGARQMVELLEIYRLTGHLPPVIESIIVKVANLAVLPDESEGQVVTVDDLVDLYLVLHGIIMGAGEIPEEFNLPDEMLADLSQVVLDQPSIPAAWQTQKPAGYPRTPNWREEAVADLGTVMAEQTPPLLRQQPIKTPPPEVHRPPAQFRAVRSTSPEEALNTLIASLSGAFGMEEGPVRPVQKVSQTIPQPVVRTAPATRNGSSSVLSDSEWSAIEHLVPAPKTGGRPSKYDRRAIVEAILHALRTKCSWRMLPDYFPPWKIVHHYYSVWREDGSWDAVVAVLGEQRIYSGRMGSGISAR
jgi:transposase